MSALSYRYAPHFIAANYARSALGLALTLGPLLLLAPTFALSVVLLGVAALFLAYTARALVRHTTRVEVDADGIRVRALVGAALRWDELRAVQLDYYSTRMDRSNGWMELVLRSANAVVRIDSHLPGFDRLAAIAAHAARRHGAALDERTLAHLAALGVDPSAHAPGAPQPARDRHG